MEKGSNGAAGGLLQDLLRVFRASLPIGVEAGQEQFPLSPKVAYRLLLLRPVAAGKSVKEVAS
nr:hypothetical protein [Hymenobacter guriensis]